MKITPLSLPSRDQRSEKGFTLIELLTVIAIIGILASILIPVVGRVRESARASKCASNLRQVAQAIHLYAEDHDGEGPAALNQWEPGQPQGGTVTVHYALWTYVGYDVEEWDPPVNFNRVTSHMENVFHCPTIRMYGDQPPGDYFYSGARDGFPHSYALNALASPGRDLQSRVPLEWAAETATLAVALAEMFDWRTTGNFPNRGLIPHSDGTNFAFYDGHVERLAKAEIPLPNNSDRNVFWYGMNTWGDTGQRRPSGGGGGGGGTSR